MNHLFVPYDIAFKLKNKGFTEPCFAIYIGHRLASVGGNWGSGLSSALFGHDDDLFKEDEIRAPLFAQVFEWLRREHDVYSVCIHRDIFLDMSNLRFRWSFELRYKLTSTEKYSTYEEAEIACLREILEKI